MLAMRVDSLRGRVPMTRDAAIVVCTRMESRRLPGKALLPIEGLTSLDHIILRTREAGIPLWLAVPNGQAAEFIHLTKQYPEIGLFEGDAESPLHRMAQLLEDLNPRPQYIVRITHDDILIDPKTMTDLLDECDRVSAGYGCSPEITEGSGVEVIRSENLIKAAKDRKEPTEFVSYFVKGEGMPYPKCITFRPRASIRRPYRLTMDYAEDALVLKIILRELGATASLDSICRYLDSRPYVLSINRKPDVTFYTCAKDAEAYVADTMLSVLGADIPNFEYIVVDDGSRDSTLSEVAKFSGDRHVTLIVNDKNMGLASSSNVALGDAQGKVIVRVDADDMLIAGAFKQAWPNLQKRIADGEQVIYPAYRTINAYGGLLEESVSPKIHHHAGCAIMNRAWLNEWRFKDGLKHWDGLELYRRAVASSVVGYHDEPIWQYRVRDDSMSNADPAARRDALMRLDRDFKE